MTDKLLDWVFLLAIGQALFLIAALLSGRQRELRSANRLLSGLLLVCCAVIFHAWLGLNGLYARYPHSALAIATLGLLTGPLLYLYLRAMLFDAPLGRRSLFHFAPFLLATLALLPFYLQPGAAKLAWMLQRGAPPWYLGVAAVAKLVFFLLYIVAGFRLMRGARAGELALGLRRLMQIWLVGGLLSVAALGSEFADIDLPVSADAIGAIALLVFVYATAWLAIRLPLSYRPQPGPAGEAGAKPRYAASTMDDDAKNTFLAALAKSIDTDQVYRNGELKLEELAGLTAMTAHELSQLINENFGTNFQDYLNGYRVTALKQALLAPGQAGDSILELGLACGFNSKSALNRIFKQHTGLTPSQWRKQGPAA
jgi:AraC-like DNA-binding protein